MTNQQKFKAFSTRLKNFILDELGGEYLNTFDSKTSLSKYYKVFHQQIRISDHLGTKLFNKYINIICPMCNTSDIIVFYKHVIYTLHSEKEVKNTLKSLCLYQEHFENNEEIDIATTLDNYNKAIISKLNCIPQELSSRLDEEITKLIETELNKRITPLFNNLVNVLNNTSAKVIRSIKDKTEVPIEIPKNEFTQFATVNPFIINKNWARENLPCWGSIGKTMEGVILDYCQSYPNRIPNVKELLPTIASMPATQKVQAWVNFKNSFE